MELRHLRYFVAVAEALSFRRAAELLNMTQPPLSQQIQQLEAELGVELFHRQGRSIALTAAGAVFLKDVRRILAMTAQAADHAGQADRGMVGQLRIGFVGSAAYRLLPRMITAFRARYPAVELRLSQLSSDEQVQALAAEQIDVGVGWVTATLAGLHTRVLAAEHPCVVLPVGHPLAQTDELQLAALCEARFILFPRHLGPFLFDRLAALCQRAGFTLTVDQAVVQQTTIIGLVAAEMGVSLLPASVAALSHPGVVYRPLSDAEPIPLSLIWRTTEFSPTVHNFLALQGAVNIDDEDAPRSGR